MIQRIKLWWKGGHAFSIAYFTKNTKLNSCDVVSTWIITSFEYKSNYKKKKYMGKRKELENSKTQLYSFLFKVKKTYT